MKQNKRQIFRAAAVLVSMATALQAQTTVRLGSDVLVADVPRLGVHASDDNYYDGPARKLRVEENFEGALFRTVRDIDIESGNVVVTKSSIYPSLAQRFADRAVAGEATYTICSGPDQWQTGQVIAVELLTPTNDFTKMRLTLDRSFTPDATKNGIILDALMTDLGYVDYSKLNRPIGSELEYNSAMYGGDVSIIDTDGAPTFGFNSMRLNGTSSSAYYHFFTHYNTIAPTEGTWKVRFWCRAQSGSPSLTVDAQPGPQTGFTPTSSWVQYETTLVVDEAAEPKQVNIRFTASGGVVLIDDVEIWMDGDTNPTAFRDEFVDILRFLNPGVMRTLVNNGDRIENRIDRRLRGYAATLGSSSVKKISWGMHEFFELGEYVGFDPWYTLPGQMNPEDMHNLIEYLAGPTNTVWGQKRATLGHPAPWTGSFNRIFLQLGNEMATFTGTGFDGPGYWEALYQAAKASPWFDADKISLVVDSQVSAGYNLANTPSSDQLCHSSYMTFGIYNSMLAPYATDAALAAYILSMPWMQYTVDNKSLANVLTALSYSREPCVYEGGNFHTTFSDDIDPVPLDTINNILTSHAGGVAGVLSMLILQREYGCRYQNSFNFNQKSFSPGGSFGNIDGAVRLWGGILSMRAESRRYRPRFLALAAVNQAAGGDLIATEYSGPDAGDTVTITNGLYSPAYQNRYEPDLIEATIEMRAVESFAYRDGNRYGLVLVNQDTAGSRDVRIEYTGLPTSAQWWRVAPSNPFNDNETEHAAEVFLEEGIIPGFTSGHTVTLPPCGLMTLSWTSEPSGEEFPVADAGVDQMVIDLDGSGREQVALDGSASYDPDGSITNYSWSVDGIPLGSGALTRMLLPLGTHTVTLSVTDNSGLSDDDTAQITVRAASAGAIAVEAAAGLSPDGGNPTTVISFTASGSGVPDYLVMAIASESADISSVTFGGASMTELHSLSEDASYVHIYGIATSATSGTVQINYSGNVYGGQICGYAFLSGVDTDRPGGPVRARGGDHHPQASAVATMNFGYDAPSVAGDFVIVAANVNGGGKQVNITPQTDELFNGDAGATFCGAVALDTAPGDGAYSSTLAFTGTLDRQVGAGIILTADLSVVEPVADGDGDGVDDVLEEFLQTNAHEADDPAARLSAGVEGDAAIFYFTRTRSPWLPDTSIAWSRTLTNWFTTGFSLSVEESTDTCDWMKATLPRDEPLLFWKLSAP